MSMQVDIVECYIKNELIKCSRDVEIDHDNKIIKLNTDTPLRLVARTSTNKSLICTGQDFQVHVWVPEKYILWHLPKGVNYCVLFNDVFLDQCDDKLYVISRKPYGCSDLTLSNCERELYRFLSIKHTPLFIVEQELSIPIIDAVNMVIQGSMEDCNRKIAILSVTK
ncbi:MAG: hypothetical protein QXE81_05310 [Desulfurococcaceae archaeon]